MNIPVSAEQPVEPPEPVRDSVRRMRRLATHVAAGILTVFLTYHALNFWLDSTTLISLMRRRYLSPGGWLVQEDFSARDEVLFFVALIFGACFPSVRLTRWLLNLRPIRFVLMGGLIGGLV